MDYNLIKASDIDIEYIKQAKLYNIFNYAHNLLKDEIKMINNYVDRNIPLEINEYKMIIINNEKVGCILVINKDDGVLIDEIYIEDNYRGRGIGTSIIEKIIRDNNIVYLWVYKENKNAISLYKRLGFLVIEETKTRFYMKRES